MLCTKWNHKFVFTRSYTWQSYVKNFNITKIYLQISKNGKFIQISKKHKFIQVSKKHSEFMYKFPETRISEKAPNYFKLALKKNVNWCVNLFMKS